MQFRLPDPAVRPPPRIRKAGSHVCATVALVLIASFTVACSAESATPPAAVTATARPETPHDALVDLAAILVGGPENMSDPATGRLPDIDAFHRMGIATLSVSETTIRIEFLDNARPSQRQAVIDVLRSSPFIATVHSS